MDALEGKIIMQWKILRWFLLINMNYYDFNWKIGLLTGYNFINNHRTSMSQDYYVVGLIFRITPKKLNKN